MKKYFIFIIIGVFFFETYTVAQTVREHGSNDVKIGIAAYTFRKFDIDSTLKMYKIADAKYMSVKDFHLPLNSTREQMEDFKKKCAHHDVIPYALGPIYMKTEEEVDNAFDYVVRFGGDLLIGVPNYELLPYVEQQVKTTGIRFAIHTHGPDNQPFPDAKDAYDRIKDMDPLIGICIDLGHTIRFGGNATEDLIKYEDRIFDIHIKDVTAPSKEGTTCEMGRGVMDFYPILESLRLIEYKGAVSLEFEKDPDYPFFGVLESIGYLRGALDMVNRKTQF
ncbi:MAG: sugar phosphate isomerase/epimerase [Dysgonamonadaceae bacterium]|jgi:sugar phosphate isomerase/epimerase|nr:sugar phosphate isomerase/epimerase [Dysgonamonadaceae bacterium]